MTLPRVARWSATLTPNASSDYDLFVYNSNGALIGRSERGTGLVDTVTVTNTGTSAFVRYVRVVSLERRHRRDQRPLHAEHELVGE